MKKRLIIYLSILVGAFTLYSFGISDAKTPASFDKYVPTHRIVKPITFDKQKLYTLHNDERSKAGLKSLNVNPLLEQAAEVKVTDMSIRKYFSHNTPEGKTPFSFILNTGYNYVYAGENLSTGYFSEGSVIEEWMNSPKHKDNILNKHYKEIGIAVKGKLVVVMFGSLN